MKRAITSGLLSMLVLTACQDEVIYVDEDVPAAPRALAASYYAYAVDVTWELAPQWNEEAFRVYSRRITDTDFFFIAEVTSCAGGLCAYQDTNVVPGETYEYFVAAVSPASGAETTTDVVEVFVPEPTPPAVPDAPLAIGLDDAIYLEWGAASRGSSDFSFYRVYQEITGTAYLLGETDSEGFLDLLAVNGETYGYFVTAVDTDGHESGGSVLTEGTPRPDYHGELLHDYCTCEPTLSGFRFVEDEVTPPVLDGDDPARHFRFETDANGAWLVAGSGTSIYQGSFETTALKCAVEADLPCADVPVAPATGYGSADVQGLDGHSYVFRVVGNDNEIHYGVIRVETAGFDQAGESIMIFDWAYQLQPGNPELIVER